MQDVGEQVLDTTINGPDVLPHLAHPKESALARKR